MKPIQLTMCAFGPYKSKEVIDFRELQGNRLFVISGSTGAGKTTIFDGISFALYGNGSGSDRREHKSLRSDFAEDKLNTAVELIFEVNHKTYRVMRQLGHVKEGNKTATGEAYEFMEVQEDGTEMKGVERQRVTDINTRIEEIIGLTYDQFNQIIMLPQGEFRKLLTSSSENKEAILRKIFKTERYGEMAKKLEEKKQLAQQQQKEAAAVKNSYIEQISGVLPARESGLFTLLEGQANVYQIQQALLEEQVHYQLQVNTQQKSYEQAFEEHGNRQKIVIEQQNLNSRIEAYEQRKQQLQTKRTEQPFYDAKLGEVEAAVKANLLETYNARCIALKADVDKKTTELESYVLQAQKQHEQLEAVERNYAEEKAKETERQQVLENVRSLEILKPVYEELETQQQTVERLNTQQTQERKKVTQFKQQLEQQKEQYYKKQQLVEDKQNQVLQLPDLLERQQHLKMTTTLLSNYGQAAQQRTMLKDQHTKAQQFTNDIQTQYEELEIRWLQNQAYQLAQELEVGCPCPVCGSLEHPGATQATAELVDEATLNQLKNKRDEAVQQSSTLSARLEVAQQATANFEQEMKQLDLALDQMASLQEQYVELNGQITTLQQEAQTLQHEKQQLQVFQQSLEQLEVAKQAAEQQFNQLDNQLGQQQLLLQQKQSQIPAHLPSLPDLTEALFEATQLAQQLQRKWETAQRDLELVRSNVTKIDEAVKFTTVAKEDFEARLITAKETFLEEMKKAQFENYQVFVQAKRTEQQIATLKHEHLTFTNELHALKAMVAEESTQLEGKEKQDLTLEIDRLQQLKLAYEQALHKLNQFKEYERNCIDYAEKLEAVAEQIAQLELTANEIIDLHNVLKGQNTRKVSFERFVQISYLEQITEAANIHLHNLSNGQYRLTCSERQESHGRQSGLALDVYDSYTGQNRDVKTLSGGEKFNASLCLALGMADVIQSFQGNVRIDTMFIDEGFGTLDEEALMRAIDVLIELQKSGRIIGVISHVAELKAAMPAVLHVVKQREGHSHTMFEVK